MDRKLKIGLIVSFIVVILVVSITLLVVNPANIEGLPNYKNNIGYPIPTEESTFAPTNGPTIVPATFPPTQAPTFPPTFPPTPAPTFFPIIVPTQAPTFAPTQPPTFAPTQPPTPAPTPAPNNVARIVRVDFDDGRSAAINLAEIQVFDLNGVNIALGKIASMSSAYHGSYMENKINDGIINEGLTYVNGVLTSMSNFTATGTSVNPFISIDLGANFAISRVVVFNRTDCCKNSINGANLKLINSAGTVVRRMTFDSIGTSLVSYTFNI